MPALDALCLKLKAAVPSFKKKKGALPAAVDQVQKEVWTAFKLMLTQYKTSIEAQAAALESAIRDQFTESAVLGSVPEDFIATYSPDGFNDEMSSVASLIREKAVEFANEKSACVERINQIATQVCK